VPSPVDSASVCLSSDGEPLPVPLPSWDAGPLPPSACSLAQGSYSPEVASELAGLRVTVTYGLGLLVLLSAATAVAAWRR